MYTGFHVECFVGDGRNDSRKTSPPRGVWGMLSQKMFEFTCYMYEVASGGFVDFIKAGN